MKTLIGIPVVNGYNLLKKSIESFQSAGFENFLIVCNGSNSNIVNYSNNYNSIINSINIGVNPSWNQIIDFFKEGDYDRLIIANSDIEVKSNFKFELKKIKKRKIFIFPNVVDEWNIEKGYSNLTDGLQGGVCMIFDKDQISKIYPVQTDTKIWFGDTYILHKLKESGYKPTLCKKLQLKHEVSATVNSLNLSSKYYEERQTWEIVKKHW